MHYNDSNLYITVWVFHNLFRAATFYIIIRGERFPRVPAQIPPTRAHARNRERNLERRRPQAADLSDPSHWPGLVIWVAHFPTPIHIMTDGEESEKLGLASHRFLIISRRGGPTETLRPA